jgi:hypothetical protein
LANALLAKCSIRGDGLFVEVAVVDDLSSLDDACQLMRQRW